ncbi:hypothetical protein ACOBQX_07555 [Actinokineospora sp. G85]|uniref:hypothetical protein n=1 Tax=Actinokineospora sp. G85 TaxID=3406626 RepID=UPI003C7637B8
MTVHTPPTDHDRAGNATGVRRYTENGCEVTVIADPADARQTLYGTVTRHGVLVGSYYRADRVRRSDWRIVTALGLPLTLDGRPVELVAEDAAVVVLSTALTARDSVEAEQRLRAVMHQH